MGMQVHLSKTRTHLKTVITRADNRPVWFPGNTPPSYLDGSMPGDYGFDPLRLGSDSNSLKWFREAELQHCRWAMLGVLGILIGEIVRPDINFVRAPQQLEGQLAFSTPVLLGVEFILMHYVEIRRWQDFKNNGSVDLDPIFKQNTLPKHEIGYPGGIFDPLGMSNKGLRESKEKEIKNGRLAMVAFVGFIVQEQVTDKNPLGALKEHLSNPGQHTLISKWAALQNVY